MRIPSFAGMKALGPLLLLSLREGAVRGKGAPFLPHLLSEQKISMAFLTWVNRRDGEAFACCIAKADEPRVRTLLAQRPDLMEDIRIHPDVGLISLYPHGFALDKLACLWTTLEGCGVRLEGMASSLGALTLVIEAGDLEKALSAFEARYEIPCARAS